MNTHHTNYVPGYNPLVRSKSLHNYDFYAEITMQLPQAIVVLAMAAGVMAGCREDANLCKSDVLSIEKGHTVGWECDIAEDRPCVTTCDVTGEREAENGSMNPILCCAPCECA